MTTATQLTTTLPSAQEWKDLLEDLLPPQGAWSENKYRVLTDHRNRLVEFTEAAGTTDLEKWQGTWVETACEWKEEGVFLNDQRPRWTRTFEGNRSFVRPDAPTGGIKDRHQFAL